MDFLQFLFDKTHSKYLLIWPITFILSFILKFYAYYNPDPIIIKNNLVFLLVFGPSFIVTIILVFYKFFKTWESN